MTPNTSFAVCTAPKRQSLHWKQDTVTWGDLVSWAESPADKKECGNYWLGTLEPTTVLHKKSDKPCTDLHRRKDAVKTRSMLSLDIDKATADFYDLVELTFPYAAILHSTFQSTPDEPRYRLLIPLDREVMPDEYIELAKSVMQDLGKEQFDPSTTEPERYMFKPAADNRDWYQHLVLGGDALPVDEVLADFEEDLSAKEIPRPTKNKRNPFDIDGIIGAFNTAYQDDWDLLIEKYELPYQKIDDSRYHLIGSRAEAGMGPISGVPGFVYSHHANDPAYGKTCSAFDLVRLHRFGELDEDSKPQTPVNKLPSHEAMVELATDDPRALTAMVGSDFSAEMDDEALANDWRVKIRRTKTGVFRDVISNWDLVVKNDPVFGLFVYNELSLSPETTGDLPWRKVTNSNRIITNVDRWQMVYYIEREYDFRTTRAFMDSQIDMAAGSRVINPVRDYLDSLVWDKIPRVEECLPGVVPTEYTRRVARKSLVAAVARMFEPGCKWDHTLVLYGNEGLGKSWWIDKMAKGYSASLGPLDNKDTLLAMQRSWIMMSDEGHSLRKADADVQKEFLTKTHDVFRMPYDRETLVHPRHCVIWSTTDNDTILRRQEGNRRFLIVHCEHKVDFEAITDDYVDQLWAEAVYLYRAGELLYLDEAESKSAALERERFVEEDALAGLISEYLDQLVPEDWWERSIEARLQWLDGRANGFEKEGTMRIDRTCSTQIWVEALGRRIGDHRRTDLLDITSALKRLPGWESSKSSIRLPGYGPQQVFVRKDLL